MPHKSKATKKKEKYEIWSSYKVTTIPQFYFFCQTIPHLNLVVKRKVLEEKMGKKGIESKFGGFFLFHIFIKSNVD